MANIEHRIFKFIIRYSKFDVHHSIPNRTGAFPGRILIGQ